MKPILAFSFVIFLAVSCATYPSGKSAWWGPVVGREYHVSPSGDDSYDGTPARPLRTISTAALAAQPGDVIVVHAGLYRERINPPRGGTSNRKRIVYTAAPGERVVITGSERVKGWEKVQDDTWRVSLRNSFFGSFNPYRDLLHGDWFSPQGRQHHSGAVYLNGDWLAEAAKLDEVFKPAGAIPLWFGEVDEMNTTLWAQFKGVDPNQQMVEINVRQTVFYPEKTNINYLTVHGFVLRQAATPWAPPTAEQMGLIGTHWSRGWLIESNEISYSKCSGVALGKYGDGWDNRAESAEGYVGTILRALDHGWNKGTIGHHVVRNNEISHCEQTGIVGSLGCAFSVITGNDIHDIHVQRLFSGAEMAGIKFHGAIDVQIRRNHVHHTIRGIWLDWMAQGTRVSRNLFHDNRDQDLFVEVDHGPFVVDNNIFLSRKALLVVSQGGAYLHNLVAGGLDQNPYDVRQTPFLKPHSTELAGFHDNPSGDDRFFNNIFFEHGDLSKYDTARLPVRMEGNLFLQCAKPCLQEKAPLLKPDWDPRLKLVTQPDGVYLDFQFDPAWRTEQTRKLVATETLRNAVIPNLPYENPDGTPLRIDLDYFGRPRAEQNPFPGPFEVRGSGRQLLKIWPPR